MDFHRELFYFSENFVSIWEFRLYAKIHENSFLPEWTYSILDGFFNFYNGNTKEDDYL